MNSSNKKAITIIINGSSSAGKTTLINYIRDNYQDQIWFYAGIDLLWNDVCHKNYISQGIKSKECFHLMPTEEKGITTIIGPVGWLLIKGLVKFIDTLGKDNNVLVDDIILNDQHMNSYFTLSQDTNCYFISLECNKSVLEERERYRSTLNGNQKRPIGLVKNHYPLVHVNKIYDLSLDSTSNSPKVLAEQLFLYVANNKPMAIKQMQKEFKINCKNKKINY